MVCTKCFAEIPDTSAFCLECGARLRDDTTDPLYAEGSDREVYPEIARANLLRMKGQYDEAVEVCLGILKRYPSNETAHALLGDIYTDQGKLTDAMQWYELLVDLAPSNPVYRAKLDNLRSMQRAQQAQPVVPPPTPSLSAPPTRAWVYGLVGLLVLILIGAAFMAGRRMTITAVDHRAQELVSPASRGNLKEGVPPTNAPTLPTPAPPAEPEANLENTLPPFSGMGEIEEQLTRAISRRLNGLPIWCLFDPLTNRWTIRTRIQAGALTRARVMQEALIVASVAFEQSPSLQSATITILTPSTGGADTLLFSAEIGRTMLPPDVHTLTDAQMEAIFQSTHVWWNPAVPLPAGGATSEIFLRGTHLGRRKISSGIGSATGTSPLPSNPPSR